MATTKIEPVVRRGRPHKRARRHAAHGNWKLVYADFVTVLMAFFIVVWILLFDLVSEREKFDKTCLDKLNVALQKQIMMIKYCSLVPTHCKLSILKKA